MCYHLTAQCNLLWSQVVSYQHFVIHPLRRINTWHPLASAADVLSLPQCITGSFGIRHNALSLPFSISNQCTEACAPWLPPKVTLVKFKLVLHVTQTPVSWVKVVYAIFLFCKYVHYVVICWSLLMGKSCWVERSCSWLPLFHLNKLLI